MGDCGGRDGLHRLHWHRRPEVEPGGDRHEAETEQHGLRIETADRDVADNERDERAEVAESPASSLRS